MHTSYKDEGSHYIYFLDIHELQENGLGKRSKKRESEDIKDIFLKSQDFFLKINSDYSPYLVVLVYLK